MDNKIKRLEKVLKKRGLTKWLKPASDSDPVDFVIMEYPKCIRHSFLCKTKDYIEMVKRGENIPEELIHYVTIRNKRDREATANMFYDVTIFIPSDPMRTGSPLLSKFTIPHSFLFGFFGNVSSKKTPLKDGIFNFFAASSSSKLLNGLFGKITFLIEIIF